MHQHAPRFGGQPLCLGVREGRSGSTARSPFTNAYATIDPAVSGLGVAHLAEHIVASHFASRKLGRVLED